MYWLSRQGLPRKAGMAASLGTAVHASIEDLLQIDLSGREPAESGWIFDEADALLRKRWEEEKQIFHDTPRHPNWKEDKYREAQKQQNHDCIVEENTITHHRRRGRIGYQRWSSHGAIGFASC